MDTKERKSEKAKKSESSLEVKAVKMDPQSISEEEAKKMLLGAYTKDPECGCRLVICEDPKTGELVTKPDGPCPVGFVEKVRERCLEEGLVFLTPKVRSREMDE
jgi:hypothetical protein